MKGTPSVAIVVVALALVAAASCGPEEGRVDPAVEKLGRASGPVEPISRAMPKAASTVHEGELLERIHVPNYTYLRLRTTGGAEEWAAIPRTEIEVGARVRVVESIVMQEFKSPSLNRTFGSIVFGVLEGGKPGATSPDAGAGRGVPR